ncbi:MAG TPA: hypothetical protein VGP72_29035 [Planctomycetota bacterium]|jgi:hypothetical protein
MAFKSFFSPTGSGNTILEGDVISGYITPQKSVVLKFLSNDRGYSCGSFGTHAGGGVPLDIAGAKALREELSALLDSSSGKTGVFSVPSNQKHFKFSRELDGGPLILAVIGTDPRFGTSYHRGNAETFKTLLAEFDAALKAIDDAATAKTSGPRPSV